MSFTRQIFIMILELTNHPGKYSVFTHWLLIDCEVRVVFLLVYLSVETIVNCLQYYLTRYYLNK